ncbi:MAG: diaminopimelate epimerase [Pseudomonadota bacterium]
MLAFATADLYMRRLMDGHEHIAATARQQGAGAAAAIGRDPAAAMTLAFSKMHGAGNDFVILDFRRRADPLPADAWPAVVRAIGDRHTGVGFDQLAVLRPAPVEEGDIAVTFWNADGSRSAACGNATRCVALILAEEGRGPVFRIAVEGRGLLTAEAREDGRFTVDMGAPGLDWRDVPLSRDMDTLALDLPGAPVALSMGNPHAVHVVEALDASDWRAIGARVECDPLFPERTNVQVVEVIDTTRILARVWERGVGPTLASGSSACAVAVACHRLGLTGRCVSVVLEGSVLDIEWLPDGPDGPGHVLMTGPAAHVFDGVIPGAQVMAMAGMTKQTGGGDD